MSVIDCHLNNNKKCVCVCKAVAKLKLTMTMERMSNHCHIWSYHCKLNQQWAKRSRTSLIIQCQYSAFFFVITRVSLRDVNIQWMLFMCTLKMMHQKMRRRREKVKERLIVFIFRESLHPSSHICLFFILIENKYFQRIIHNNFFTITKHG